MLGVTSRKIRKSKIFKRVRRLYGCGDNEKYARGSCSAYTLTPAHFRDLLDQTIEESSRGMYRQEDYRKALCRFFSGRRTCYGKHLRQARIIENMAKRYASVYNRSRPGFKWTSPYTPKPTLQEEYDRDYQRELQERRRHEHRLIPEIELKISPPGRGHR